MTEVRLESKHVTGKATSSHSWDILAQKVRAQCGEEVRVQKSGPALEQ